MGMGCVLLSLYSALLEVILPLPEARMPLHCTEQHCSSLNHPVPNDPCAKKA